MKSTPRNPDDFFDPSVASSTECTGLAPSAIQTAAEADAYTDLYDIPLTDDPIKAGKRPRAESPKSPSQN